VELEPLAENREYRAVGPEAVVELFVAACWLSGLGRSGRAQVVDIEGIERAEAAWVGLFA
jgi:hypothetical protein